MGSFGLDNAGYKSQFPDYDGFQITSVSKNPSNAENAYTFEVQLWRASEPASPSSGSTETGGAVTPSLSTKSTSETHTNSTPHTHSYQWKTLKESTVMEDGLEVYTCSCGVDIERKCLPAVDVFLKEFTDKLAAGKPGDTVIIELGLRNSLSKSMMEQIAAKRDIDLVLHFTYENINYELTIPRDAVIDTSLDWYGPEKLKELFGFIILN